MGTEVDGQPSVAAVSAPIPRVVLITGAPGSGKSTLGATLASELRVPFLARDDVRGGQFLTAGSWSDRPQRVPAALDAVEAFLRIVEGMVDLGVSCVVEYVVRAGRPSDLARLTASADCVVVATWCRDPLGRFADRNRADRLLNRRAVLDALGYEDIEQQTAAASERMRRVSLDLRTEFDLPLLRVRTDDGYDPGLARIIEFATAAAPAARRSPGDQ